MTRDTRSSTRVAAMAWALAVAWLWAAPGGHVAAAGASADPFFSRWETIGVADGLPSAKVSAVLVDGDRVWAGTDAGLAALGRGAVKVVGTAEGLPFPVVTALAKSPLTGDLWVGTMGGLARLSAGRVDAFTQLDSGLANNVVYGVTVDGADVWVATAAGLSRYDTRTGDWQIFDISNTLMHEPWTYAVTAAEDGLYVAVWGGGILVRERATGRFRAHRDPDGEVEIDLFRDDGLVHDVTSSVAVSNGVLWAGTYFGLSRYDGRRWRSFGQEDSGLAGDFINAVVARDGVVWIATDQGVSRFDDAIWHTWRRQQDGPGFELRITGADGMSRVEPQETGPAHNFVFGLAPDRGDLWLATAAGLSHGIARAKAERGAVP